MEGQKDIQYGVSSGIRQQEGASGLCRTAGPSHTTKSGTSPLTQKARGQRGVTSVPSLTNSLETQHPRALGLKEPNILGVASEQPQSLTQYDKYLIVEGTGGEPLSRQSPFVIQKLFKDVEAISRLRSGSYLIATRSEQQSNHFLRSKKIGDCLIQVKPHMGLNQIKGVIESEALKFNITKEEIIEDLKDYGVADCYFHQKRLQSGLSENSGRVTLTFKGQKLPDKVTIAGWLHCRVRTYVPNPLRCFKCQLYGHTSKNCRREKRCSICGGGDCQEQCGNPMRCVNCGGEHTSFDRSCPKWIQEKEVQKIKAQQNISYKEAKSQVSSRRITSGVSYSAAVQSTPQGCSQQSPAVVDVLQAVLKQMEQLQKQLHIMSKKVGVNVNEETAGEEPQNTKTTQRKRSLTRNGSNGPSEDSKSKRRTIEPTDDSTGEMEYSDEAMAAMSQWITSEWNIIEDKNLAPPKEPRTKTGRNLPVAVKPQKSPQSSSGHPTTATKAAANAASGESKNAKSTPPKREC